MLPDYRRDNPYQRLLAGALAEAGVNVTFPGGYRRGLPLFRRIRAGRFDVLHLHWLTPYIRGAGALAHAFYCAKLCVDLLLVRLTGVKIVWTLHNRLSHEAAHPAQERFLQRTIARLAHARVVHSPSAARLLGSDLSLDPAAFTVIPHGHYRDAYGPAIPPEEAKTRLGLCACARVFLYFGMLRPYKGVDALIRTWTELRTSPNDTLMIAGYTADKAYVRQLESLAAAAPNVRLDIRTIPDAEIPLYFSAAHVVVLPFRQVLTSGSMLLAMSYARPVVAPHFEELSETLRDAGALLYEDGRLKQSLERVLAGGVDIESLSGKTRQQCDNLDWSLIAKSTRACYEKALHKDL